MRDQRHTGLYSWAQSQLGLQGKSKPREEFWKGCRIGRYRWLDNSSVRARTLNNDLATIPFWLSELETNCCRRNAANWVFKHLLGVDTMSDFRFPEIVVARKFWERNKNNLRWSRIMGHYVPGPDR